MTEDFSRIIVIKKQEKERAVIEECGDLFYVVNDAKNELQSQDDSEDDIIYYNHGISSGDSSDTQTFLTEEQKPHAETSDEISFPVPNNTGKTYNVVCHPRENAEVVGLDEVKLKEEKKTIGDALKSPCPFCNKMLTRVDEHIRLLHRNRVYVCTKYDCGAEFLTLKNLQSHQLRCFDVKKAYKCQRCHKEFHRKSNFKAHFRRHSNKKDFQCQLCDRAFVDSTGLRRHFLKHHEPEQEVFVSGCCGKKFKSKEGLKKHIRKSICGIQIVQVLGSDNRVVEINTSQIS